MPRSNTFNDVFRFVQLRPPAPAKTKKPLPLTTTSLAARLEGALSAAARTQAADAALQTGTETVRTVSDLPGAAAVIAAIDELREQPDATADELLARIGKTDALQVGPSLARLSDTLLASFFASRGVPANLEELQDLYRVYNFLQSKKKKAMPLAELLRRPLMSPFAAPAVGDLTVARADTPATGAPQDKTIGRVRSAGMADLLVVKQQIKRYEPSEIAHVENVLNGEKKSRSHRRLQRTEETFTQGSETIHEQAHELETTDRFELQRETSSTISQEQQYGLDLSLSLKYGKTVEFSSQFEMDIKKSKQQSEKNASNFAHNVVERSLDKITQKVHEQRVRKMIQETEETNLHELDNKTGAHVRGIYQFIDKIYEAQVFNYGLREMFDFVVPEPASFLWWLTKKEDTSLDLPPKPKVFNHVVNELTWKGLVDDFGPVDLEPPPSRHIMLATDGFHGEADATEVGKPRSVTHLELQVPAGYRPITLTVSSVVLTDLPDTSKLAFGVTVGGRTQVWTPDDDDGKKNVSDKHTVHWMAPPMIFNDLFTHGEMPDEGKLGISVMSYESATYAVSVQVECERSGAMLERWETEAFKKIQAASIDRLHEWEQKVEKLQAEARAAAEQQQPFGVPPAENRRTILRELKKHCLAIITKQRFESFDATKDGAPPFFDFNEAEGEGSFIRFFEQAFEWDQMQYVFYPYFWSRRGTWQERFETENVDPELRDFLQAGAARVVVPARPGFEIAVTHFLETGKLWNGLGEPPQINSDLYLSIIEEIRDRTGAPEEEEPVGEPWDIRVPTSLVLLRAGADLPEWQRVAPDIWQWEPVEEEP
jgi:hypothetical protein